MRQEARHSHVRAGRQRGLRHKVLRVRGLSPWHLFITAVRGPVTCGGQTLSGTGGWRSKEKKLLKTMKFAKELLDMKVDLGKVNWTVMRVWVAQRLTELLGLEDEVLIGYVLEQLEGQKARFSSCCC